MGVSPLEDEKVTFRIASNVRVRRAAEAAGGLAAIHSGRRAVQVWQDLPYTAKPSIAQCNTPLHMRDFSGVNGGAEPPEGFWSAWCWQLARSPSSQLFRRIVAECEVVRGCAMDSWFVVGLQVYPLVQAGTVVLVKPGFGFLEAGEAGEKSRLYFSLVEVRKPQNIMCDHGKMMHSV